MELNILKGILLKQNCDNKTEYEIKKFLLKIIDEYIEKTLR